MVRTVSGAFRDDAILRAVDTVDEIHGELNNGESRRPPQLCTDLLKLPRLAIAVFNDGSQNQIADLFERAVDLGRSDFRHDDRAQSDAGNTGSADRVPGTPRLHRTRLHRGRLIAATQRTP